MIDTDEDAAFWRPVATDIDSDWYGHVPFASWAMAACTPSVVVQLGTELSVSYFALCEAVLRLSLPTCCFAIRKDVPPIACQSSRDKRNAELRALHDSKYGAFSQQVVSSESAISDYILDGSVDLLHFAGGRSFEQYVLEYQLWTPKLSPRAVIFIDETSAQQPGFEAWRFWKELAKQCPAFEFLHARGLGVVCVGAKSPTRMLALCTLAEPPLIGRVRARFSMLGERWALENRTAIQLRELDDLRNTLLRQKEAYIGIAARADALESDLNAGRRPLDVLQAQARTANARAIALELEIRYVHRQSGLLKSEGGAGLKLDVSQLAAELSTAKTEITHLEQDARLLRSSTSWRITAPLRFASVTLRRLRLWSPGKPVRDLGQAETSDGAEVSSCSVVHDEPAAESANIPRDVVGRGHAADTLRILYAAGEPNTPGCEYRCVRYAEAARMAGHDADWIYVEEINGRTLIGVDLVVLWRVPWSAHVEGIVAIVRANGGRVALDLDDLMIQPELARISTIDGIRSIQSSEGSVRDMFTRMRQTLEGVDFATATTDELAHAMRSWLHAAYVLPNGFDHATHDASRQAFRAKKDDGLLRVGYAGGTRTHQKDFAIVVPALVGLLRARQDARLVLFFNKLDKIGLVLLYEFPELEALEEQIEWREQVPLSELPAELARFDINLAPLIEGNPFVEAKSELKWFEAALAGVPTIATPTGPFRRAIRDGETGILASTPDDWMSAIRRLADDPALRATMARNAYHAAVFAFGPERRALLVRAFLDAQLGGEPAAAAFVAELHGQTLAPAGIPVVTANETLFAHDAGGQAEVTVIIPSYNYADVIAQALESVRLQTLPVLDLVIVDDRSPDPETMAQILDFAHIHAGRFNRLLVLRHLTNAGLGGSRNTGFAHAETPYVLPLDADNRLRPECAETLLGVLRGTLAAFAYPRRQFFDGSDAQQGGDRYEPQRLVVGNYIDAMAMIAKWAWAAAGGYYVRRDAMGWEDFDLWCSLAERGLWGIGVADVLTEYRVHADSMINEITEKHDNKRAMVAFVEQRHPWLDIAARDTTLRA